MADLNTPHGADIRALRKARGVTLEELAGQLDRSVGWISQVERDISVPTPEDITDIAAALKVNTALLSGPANSPIVRAAARRQIGPRAPGLFEEYLSPDLTDDFEVIHSTFAPGAEITDSVSRPTQEVAYLAAGRLDVQIEAEWYTIERGDSFRIRGEAYRWRNPYEDHAVAIWIIAPPVY